MHFVPEISTFVNYLTSRSSFKKSEKDRLRQNIFENSSNTIVICKEFVNYIEKEIDESHELRDQCNVLIKSLIDNENNESLSINLTKELTDQGDLFEELIKKAEVANLTLGIAEDSENVRGIKKILNLANLKIGTKNYVFSKLLTNEVCQIRHINFDQKEDLIPLLNHVYDLYCEYSDITIIDRQSNLNHTIYDHLISKSIKFKYYTLKASLADARVIKEKLKIYELYSTNDNNLIHERCLIIKDIIITMDEDPFNILHRDTWTITIEHCKLSTIKIHAKCKGFTKTLM